MKGFPLSHFFCTSGHLLHPSHSIPPIISTYIYLAPLIDLIMTRLFSLGCGMMMIMATPAMVESTWAFSYHRSLQEATPTTTPTTPTNVTGTGGATQGRLM